MNALFRFAALTAALLIATAPRAQYINRCMDGIELSTYAYATHGADTLRLDVLVDPSAPNPVRGRERPVILFASGGGWEGQARNAANSDIIDLLPYMARHGYVAVGADYRCHFKKARRSGRIADMPVGDYVIKDSIDNPAVWQEVITAIDMAAADLADATAYVVAHAEEWGADPGAITAIGSSASAITFLTLEHKLCNADTSVTARLPEGFNYAAVIAMAGGVWTASPDSLQWASKPCPLMMFHGDADPIVTYSTVVLPKAGGAMHGVEQIAEQADAMRIPYALYTLEGCDHAGAVNPMLFNRPDILSFIDRTTREADLVAIRHRERGIDGPHHDPWQAAWRHAKADRLINLQNNGK